MTEMFVAMAAVGFVIWLATTMRGAQNDCTT